MTAFRNLGSRLKVGVRVAIGFASILVLLGVVAGVAYYGLTSSYSNTNRFALVQRGNARVAAVNSLFPQMRREVLVVTQNGSDQAEKNARELEKQIVENLDEAQKLIIAPERQAMLGRVKEAFAAYVGGFEKIVKAKADQARMDTTLRPIGTRMGQILSEQLHGNINTADFALAAYAGAAQDAMLSARLNMNVYFLNPQPAFAKATLDNLAKIQPAIERLGKEIFDPKQQAVVKELSELAGKYVPGVTENVKLSEERTRIVEEMGTKLSPPMADALKELSQAQVKALDEIRDNALGTINWATVVSLVATGIAVVIGLALAFFISRGISKPLGKMSGVLAELAQGNKAVEIPYTDRGDEVGDNARAAQTFKENLLRVEQMEAEQKAREAQSAAEREAAMQKMANEFEAAVGGIVKAAVAGDFSQRVDLEGKTGMVLNVGSAINSLCDNVAKALDDLIGMLEALAAGDMTRRITSDYDGNFAVLKDNANTTAERIGATIGEIKVSAREVTSASAEISTSTTDLSQRTEEQAASLEETSASMEQIAGTVRKNAENAQAANSSAANTQTVADRGGQVVAQAVKAMAKIEESSRKISDIIGVIDEIARQTNLLALNAAVEAARAGEAGRGFAVVASEVRSLAQRSSQAAKDIKDLITNSNDQVKDGVDLVNKAGVALNEIVESIKSVAAIVSEIANASTEQASGIEQVNKALNQMDEVTQQNSALVEENAATAKTLEHQARAMDERVSTFRLEEGGAEVRPAVAAPTRGPAARIPAARTQGALALKEESDEQEF